MMVNNETLIGTVTPTVYVDKITLESGSDDNLKVSLDLVVKDILDSNLMSSWFNQLDFTKMVKIRVIQVDDERLFNLLNNKQMKDKKKIKYSDYVVVNENNLNILKRNLLTIISKYE